jgi:hypothetical protein
MGKVPRLAMDGTGGAYFLNSNPKSVVAVCGEWCIVILQDIIHAIHQLI